MNRLWSALAFLLALSLAQQSDASDHQQLEKQVIANIIYELPRYVTFSNKISASLSLCVNSDAEIYRLLEAKQKRTFRSIGLVTDDTTDYDVIYTPHPKTARRLIKQTGRSPTLLLSNYASFIEEGGNIAIVDTNGRIEILLNLGTARERGLTFSPDLLELSARVIQ